MAFQVFGGGAVQSAYVSYVLLDIEGTHPPLNDHSITLVWPNAYIDVPYTDPSTGISYNTMAKYMNVLTGIANPYTITLPDATQTSKGQEFIITNIGASTFNLYDAGNSLLIECEPGISYYSILQDNSTISGDWLPPFTFGAGTSIATALALAGYGLTAIGPKLNTEVPTLVIGTVQPIDATDRASLIVWVGGVATLTLPSAVSIASGYYVSFNNQAPGGATEITITTPDAKTIDSKPTVSLFPGQSVTIIYNGTNWNTLGLGMNQAGHIGFLPKDVSGSANINLTSIESSNLIQEYSGILTGDITVFFTDEINNWIISNKTTGNFTLSVQLAGPVGTAYVIPQGTIQSFANDLTTIFPAGTSTPSLAVGNGTAAAPAITFGNVIGNAPGFYYDPTATGKISIANGGNRLAYFLAGGVGPATDFSIIDPTNVSPFLIAVGSNTTTSLYYNNNNALDISNTGVVTLPTAPLPIGSGGTDATTQPAAALSLFPPTTAGNMLFYNGTNWIVVPPGTAGGQVLTWVSPTVPPTWS